MSIPLFSTGYRTVSKQVGRQLLETLTNTAVWILAETTTTTYPACRPLAETTTNTNPAGLQLAETTTDTNLAGQ